MLILIYQINIFFITKSFYRYKRAEIADPINGPIQYTCCVVQSTDLSESKKIVPASEGPKLLAGFMLAPVTLPL